MSPDTSEILPELREDLQLAKQPLGHDGVCHWQIHDPLQHRYFRISEDTKRILSIWGTGNTFGEFIILAKDKLGINLTPAALHQLVHFLQSSNLCKSPEFMISSDPAKNQMKEVFAKGSLLLKAIFFKIPLLNPEFFLKRAKPYTDICYTRLFNYGAILITIAGAYLSAFDMLSAITSPLEHINAPNLFQIGIALIILKTCHEVGHAVSAFRAGCRVPTLGIAFMAFIPLLYTDVSDSWRLQSRTQRILISASGMIVEIYLAGISTFLWSFMTDGAVKDIVFYIATVGWISSLVFNLNPLAKFDGYYILSDVSRIANLQLKSTALARWKLRQVLLFPNLPAPEDYPRKLSAVLIVFGVLCWAYRLAISLGIAYLLYSFTAKIIGIVLLGLTLFQLVLLPVWREMNTWGQLVSLRGSEASYNRPLILSAILLLGFVVPLSGTVYAPSVLVASELQKVYPPEDARIAAVYFDHSTPVKGGTPLIDFEIPEKNAELDKVELEIEAAKRRLGSAVANRQNRSNLSILQREVMALAHRRMELQAEIDELKVVSQVDGRVIQVSKGLQPGNWVARDQWVAILGTGSSLVARGYLYEEDLNRITLETSGRFIPDDPSRKTVRVAMTRVSPDAARQLELPELSSANGGPVHTYAESGIGLRPLRPVFPIELRVVGLTESPNQMIRGIVVLDGQRESLANKIWRQLARVFVKETVF